MINDLNPFFGMWWMLLGGGFYMGVIYWMLNYPYEEHPLLYASAIVIGTWLLLWGRSFL
jgi:hypothetical protein